MITPKSVCDELNDLEIIRKALVTVDYFSCLYDRYEKQLLRYIRRVAFFLARLADRFFDSGHDEFPALPTGLQTPERPACRILHGVEHARGHGVFSVRRCATA